MTPTDPEGDDLVPLSALNALLYCDRRAALRHLDGLYVHNEHTLRGDRLHARADTPGVERRKRVRTERGLWIASRRLRLYGRADLVEFHRPPGPRRRGAPLVEIPFPVEYKRGRKRRWDNDDVQLCARPSASKKCSTSPSPEAPSTTKKASPAETSNSPLTPSRDRIRHRPPPLSARIQPRPPRRPQTPVPRLLPPRPLPPRRLQPLHPSRYLPPQPLQPRPLRLTNPSPNPPGSHDQFPPQSR